MELPRIIIPPDLHSKIRRSHRSTVFSICCAPCRLQNGYYVPVKDPLLTNILEEISAHPIEKLSGILSRSSIEGVEQVVILIDDLDVGRNWILPPNYQAEELDEVLENFIREQTSILMVARPPFRIEIVRFSDFLRQNSLEKYFSDIFSRWATFLEWIFRDEGGPKTSSRNDLKNIVIQEIAKRRTFYKKHHFKRDLKSKAFREKIFTQSIRHLANYLAQSHLFMSLGAKGYIALEQEEVGLMSLADGSFKKFVISA